METAVLAHALAVIDKVRYGAEIDVSEVALAAMFHDAAETITGDLPTPVKYGTDDMKEAYKRVETHAEEKLVAMLPPDLANEYIRVIRYPETYRRYIKAADKLSAIIKCIEEKNSGNRDFDSAYDSLMDAVKAMGFAPANDFINEFLRSYSLTVDEQQE